MRTDNIAFLSGFLAAYAGANAGVNYGPDYWLTLVPSVGTPLESVIGYHEFIRIQYEKTYPKSDLLPKLAPLETWKQDLPLLLNKWFFQGEFAPSFVDDETRKKSWIVKKFGQELHDALEGSTSVYRLEIFFSENEADDWLFQDEAGLYHLHLGWSD